MKKYRVKTNVLIITMFILLEALPIVDVLNNKIIVFIYYLIQFIIINILYKRVMEELKK